jgi:hypothetical protein
MDPITHATYEPDTVGSYEPTGRIQLDPAWPAAELGI